MRQLNDAPVTKKPYEVFEAGSFWLREGGYSTHVWRLSSFDRLPVWEQLLCRLLGTENRPVGNGADAKRIAGTGPNSVEAVAQTAETLDEYAETQLLELIEREQVASYVGCQLQTPEKSERIGRMLSADFHTKLRRLISRAAVNRSAFLDRFDRLHEALKDVWSEILFLKGPGLASLVYPQQELRLSGDIDLLATPESLQKVEAHLLAAGYRSDLTARIQTGAAPAGSVAEVCLQPDELFVCCDALVFKSDFGEFVELKIDPLDSGFRMPGLDRLFADSVFVEFADRQIRCPGLEDQLLIACCHLRKDVFREYRRMLDIHLIVEKLNRDGYDWSRFVDLCQSEFLSDPVWMALSVTRDRLGTHIEGNWLDRLKPSRASARWFGYTLHYVFLWNYNSLPMLITQIILSDDRDRRAKALMRACFPSGRFLRNYYFGNDATGNFLHTFIALWLHWFVLVMPSAVIKRSLGHVLWKDRAR